jgi:hypothetical protein
MENGDWLLSDGIQYVVLGVGARPASASYTQAGIVQLADAAGVLAGTSDTTAITPQALQYNVIDSVTTANSSLIASATAVKTAYDAGTQGQTDAAAAQATANAALPKAGGTMTGTITAHNVNVQNTYSLQFAGGVNGSLDAVTDLTNVTSSTTAASATAVKSAYDLADSALQRAGGTMTGSIVFVAGQTFPISGIQDATTGQKGVVQIGTNINVTGGTISVPAATTGQQGVVQIGSNVQVSSGTISVLNSSTTQSGVVQLNDTVSSTSTTQALTANQGYQLQQQINALSTSNNVTFAGTFNAASSVMVTVTNEGAAVGFNVGSGLPPASSTIAEYFVIVSTAGTTTPPGGVPTVANVGDWFLASASSWTYIAAGYLPPAASTTTPGIVELATNSETQAGTNSNNAVVPSALQSKMSDSVSTTSSTTIASSTAVKSAYDFANAAVPRSCYTALGALAAGTGSGTVGTLSVGTTGQFLAANTSCSTGLQWCTISLACIPCSSFTASGQLLAGTGTSTFTALGAGSNGQFLAVDNTCAGGLKWVTAAGANICGFTCALTPFNTALGSGAGALLSSLSVANTAIGYFALDSESVGDFNTAVGHNALTAQNGPTGNTAVGGNAGAQVVGGGCNTLIGYNTGDALTTGSNNTALGFNSLGASISGTCNVAIGVNALAAAVTSSGAVAVGANALAANTSGAGNTAVGFNAGLAITTGSNNTILGFNAADNITTGTQNTFLGACTGGTVAITSEGNTAVGFSALGQGITSGAYNVAVGTNAGLAVSSGATNTLVGFSAGSAITTGGGNTLIGRYAGTATLTNNVVLSDGAGNIKLQVNENGAVGVGTTPGYGTAGQILVSGGSGAAPTWTSSGTASANYGSFVRTTTQTNAGGASGNAVSYDTTSSANNFSIVSGSRITAAVAGTYQILASLQVQKTDGGTDDVNFWIKKNGVNEPNSAYNLTLQGSGAAQLGYINWVVTLAAGEYVELWWYSADANARLLTDPAVAPYPAVPASGFIIHPMGA